MRALSLLGRREKNANTRLQFSAPNTLNPQAIHIIFGQLVNNFDKDDTHCAQKRDSRVYETKSDRLELTSL